MGPGDTDGPGGVAAVTSVQGGVPEDSGEASGTEDRGGAGWKVGP